MLILILAADELSSWARLVEKCIDTVPGLAIIVLLTICVLAIYHFMWKDVLEKRRVQTDSEKVIALAMQTSSTKLAEAAEYQKETSEGQAAQRSSEQAEHRLLMSELKTQVEALRSHRAAGG